MASATRAAETTRLAGPREWFGLAVLATAALVIAIDTSVVLLALPSIAVESGADASQQLWIVDAYGFALAGLLVAFGGLADRLGRRRMAMFGAATIAIASAVAAFAPSPEVLIAARALTGVGAAALTPALYGLLTGMFRDDRQRSVALGLFMTCLMGGMIVGPLVGGMALSSFWWGSVFLIAVPVMVLVLAMLPFTADGAVDGDGEEARRNPHRRGIDPVSVPLSLLAVLPIVFGFKESARIGIQWAPVVAIALGAYFLVAFVRRQRRLADDPHREPLLDLSMFRRRGFSLVLFSLFLMTMLTGPLMMLNTQYFQLVAGADVLAAGLYTVPPAIVGVAGFVVAPLVARRIRPGFVISAGLALTVVGLLVMAQISPSTGPLPLILGFSLVSFGAAPLPTLGTNLIIGSVPLEKASSAASTSETSGQLGYALGIAVLGSIVTAVYRLQMTSSEVGTAQHGDAAESLAGAVDIAVATGDGVLRAASAAAYCSGVQASALLAAVIMAILAVVTAVRLRRIGRFGR
ncbi:DHA2 family multidrug resistance protein-like MFS transporter [Agromyces hippuratus]|uniref:DHA2 family multidrug resistance protein-like MFS transporter n=2 Tax=Agromyces hippuratus TaxID=286438 RepID=A0A852X4P5_9MICO|nr:MFS transporter [Agromyces hippuratus]NYG21011.1 DHA2 family multidrug resistance protein-like MFS transporter [Agromyces hippuratus]